MTSFSNLHPLEGCFSTVFDMFMSKTGATNISSGYRMLSEVIRRSIQRLGLGVCRAWSYACDIFRLLRHPERAKGNSLAWTARVLLLMIHFRFLASTISFPLYSAAVNCRLGTLVPGLVGKQNFPGDGSNTIAKDGEQRVVQRPWLPASTKVSPGCHLVCCIRDGQTAARSIQLRVRRGGRGPGHL